MVENNTMVSVTNRSGGSVGYVIPDMGNLFRKLHMEKLNKFQQKKLEN